MNLKLRDALIATLSKHPASYAGIAKRIGVSHATVKNGMRVLRSEGVAVPAGARRDCKGSGSPKKLWKLAPSIEADPGAVEAYHEPVTEADRFWSKVNKNGPTMEHMDTPCWEWTAGRMSFGYGQFHRADGRGQNAHRACYDLFVKPVPDDKDVLHHCDNPPCVRPAHLYVGTDSDNRMDAIRRGRDNTACGDANGNRTRPDRVPRAECHGMSKLTWVKVGAIRERRATGETLQSLANSFGVSPGTIHAVVHNQRWVRNVKDGA